MTAPTAPIRWACARHLIDILAGLPDLDGVLVAPGFPGDKLNRPEMVWLDAPTGRVSVPVMTPGRRVTDDQFTLRLQIRVAGHQSLDGAMERLEELIGIVYGPIVEGTSTLEDFPGVVSATPGELNGPTAAETPADGVLGFALLAVEVHTRIE